MNNEKSISLDVAVVGGGPAGISACLELSKSSQLDIALFESESELGGMPRSCHIYFGMRDLKRSYRGRAYAQKLNQLVRKTPTHIHTQATVLRIIPGNPGTPHRIDVVSQEGLKSYDSRFVLLATGCFESSRQARFIPGTRPAGIFTTGALQQLVNLRDQKPGKRALIIGSELIAFSSVLTLKRCGMSIAGMVEEDTRLHTYPSLAKAMGVFYRFPIYKDTSLKAILGDKRVEAVELARNNDQDVFKVECDTLIITGKFRPDSALIDNTPIERNPLTSGPSVNQQLMASVPNIFAAGNVLRGADMHDLCALEGKKAAQSILKRLESPEPHEQEGISLKAEPPIRYVVPQKIVPDTIGSRLFPLLYPGFSIQMEHTVVGAVLEACSGDEKIWSGSFSRLIAKKRYLLPVEKFDWNRVVPNMGVTLRLRDFKL